MSYVGAAVKPQRAHRVPQAGVSAKKKKDKDLKKKGVDHSNQINLKAFSYASAVRAARSQRRNQDREHRKQHVQIVNRTVEEPPFLVAVVGPPGSGKTTLIKSLVKYYTKHNLAEVKGPITVVTGKKRRTTFFECPSDLNAMCDLAKSADMVLLLIDASFGFEMETFEFLNILKIHGFPKVMGVLTHLDKFKQNKSLQKTKKTLKQRFWVEVVAGAKVFYLSGMMGGRYNKREIINLARYISITKFRPLTWRNTHPAVMIDRFEDITDPVLVHRNPKADRQVSLYGWVRGTYLKPSQRTHLLGVGDFDMHTLSILPDPCPLVGSDDLKRRSLNEKEKKLYAPMADIGDVTYDQDATYITLKRSQVAFSRPDQLSMVDQINDADDESKAVHLEDLKPTGAGESMVRGLQGVQVAIDEKMQSAGMKLFKNSSLLQNTHGEDEASDDGDDSDAGIHPKRSGEGAQKKEDIFERIYEKQVIDDDGTVRRKVFFKNQVTTGAMEIASEDEDEEEEGEEGEGSSSSSSSSSDSSVSDSSDDPSDSSAATGMEPKWKEGLAARAEASHAGRMNLMEMVYGADYAHKARSKARGADDMGGNGNGNGNGSSSSSDDDDDEGDFFTLRGETTKKTAHTNKKTNALTLPEGMEDSCRAPLATTTTTDVVLDPDDADLRSRFVTGDWVDPDASDADEDEEGEGGEEDDVESDEDGITVYDEEDGEVRAGETEEQAMERRRKAKAKLKGRFNKEYDGEQRGPTHEELSKADTERKQEINRSEFEGEDDVDQYLLRGAPPGAYVRIVLENVPCELVTNFDLRMPLILGGLLPSEQNLGFVQVRIKRHRWYPKILKTNDPIIFSLGWRRFQSLPIYSIQDPNERNRFLKYTPEHMHCTATFFGPITPPSTGILAYQYATSAQTSFRICATGVVTQLSEGFKIMKKLKLTGTPQKIQKNTAWVRGMFTSELEIAKFEGAKIRTVSGIRGQIKKAAPTVGPPGTFRATFEDKVLMSDIVFCRTWTTVDPVEYYNPVSSMLSGGSENWKGMRPIAQIRREEKKAVPFRKDSQYKPIVRHEREFNPLHIPKTLEQDLPFHSKPKQLSKRRTTRPTLEQRRPQVVDREGKQRSAVLQQLSAIKNVREKKQKIRQATQGANRLKRKAKEDEKFAASRKEKKKKAYAKAGKEDARRKAKQGGKGIYTSS